MAHAWWNNDDVGYVVNSSESVKSPTQAILLGV